MPDKKLELEISARNDKLRNVVRQSEAVIKTYGDKTLSVMKRVNDSIVGSYNRLGALAPLGIGVGFGYIAKNVMTFDDSLRALRRSGGYTKEDMSQLREQILNLSQEIPVTADQFAVMAKELSATGIPMSVIKDVLPSLGKGAKAAGVDTGIYAGAVGELLDKYKVAAADLPALQDQLNTALKFEDVRGKPEEFLRSLQGLSQTMQLMKSQGMGNVTPLMALMAQLTAFTGSSGEASASLEGLFNGILRISKNKEINAQLKSKGINFFDSKGGVKNISELLPMIRKFGEELKKSGKSAEEGALAVFGKPEAAKAVLMIMDKYDEVIKKQDELGKSSDDMGKDYTDAQQDMSNKLIMFQNQINKFNVTHMSTALEKLSGILDMVNENPAFTTGVLSVAGLGAIVVGVNKVVLAFKGLAAILGVSSIAAAGVGLLAGGAFLQGKQMQEKAEKDATEEYIDLGEGNVFQNPYYQSLAAAPVTNNNNNQNKVNVSINIEKNGRVTTTSDDMNTKIDVPRGNFYGPE